MDDNDLKGLAEMRRQRNAYQDALIRFFAEVSKIDSGFVVSMTQIAIDADRATQSSGETK